MPGSYTPKQGDWGWFGDNAAVLSGGDALASENAAYTLTDEIILRLRHEIIEDGGANGTATTWKLQYSEDDSTNWTDLGPSAHWDYANGQNTDGAALADTAALVADSASETGFYAEAAQTSFQMPKNDVLELDWAITPVHGNYTSEGSYYFRIVEGVYGTIPADASYGPGTHAEVQAPAATTSTTSSSSTTTSSSSSTSSSTVSSTSSTTTSSSSSSSTSTVSSTSSSTTTTSSSSSSSTSSSTVSSTSSSTSTSTTASSSSTSTTTVSSTSSSTTTSSSSSSSSSTSTVSSTSSSTSTTTSGSSSSTSTSTVSSTSSSTSSTFSSSSTTSTTSSSSSSSTTTLSSTSSSTTVTSSSSTTTTGPLSYQYARPISDVTEGGWLPSEGEDLYAMVDEVTPNDDDYIYSSDDPTNDVCEMLLDSLDDPQISTNHTIRYRIRKHGDGTANLTFYLMEGVTQRATWTENDVSDTIYQGSYTLSEAEADSITDYTNLRIRLSATVV